MAKKIERAVEEDTKEKETNKYFYIIAAVIILVFAAFIIYQRVGIPTGAVITIDDLHELNLQGDLSSDKGYVHNGFSFVFNN